MKNLKYFERIEAYLSKKGDPLLFEKELEQNEELKSEYNATIAANKTMDFIMYKQVRHELNKIKHQKPSRIISIQKRIISVAAVFLILIAGSTLWYANSNYSNTSLATTNYIEPNFSTVRGENSKDVLTKGINAFYKNNFDECLISLSAIKENAPSYINAQFISGFAYLKKGSYANAISAFKKVSESDKNEFKLSAKWHLMIALLHNNDKGKALDILNQFLQDKDNNYYQKAKELKRKLDSNWQKLVL